VSTVRTYPTTPDANRRNMMDPPGRRVHLDHNATRTGYLGPSQACSNLAAAAAVVNGRRARAAKGEMPYRWSQMVVR
jgi:hypothetical protein